ncbi:N-6 DNA methylase [candidate division KSB1 bacterium]
MTKGNLDVKTLENWLWDAACKLRGEIDAPKYKDYILPVIFLKRLSDVFDDEMSKLKEKFGTLEVAEQLVEGDHKLVRFFVPREARWTAISAKTTGLGELLTDAVRATARENPKLQGVIDRVDFNATESGQRILSDERLGELLKVLGDYRLGIEDVEPDILGRAYEYLLRKFAEGSGQSAGEFYTPREVAVLMSYLLDPESGQDIYDPCSGSGGLLIKCSLRFREKYKKDAKAEPIKFFGQEIQPSTFAMSKMNAFIHEMETEIKLGDTMRRPAFRNSDGSLRKFDTVTANPMWNQDFPQDVYEHDAFERFTYGYPPSSSADWGWIQHMFTSLNDNGKMAVVLDTGAVSRGSGNTGKNRERDIRKEFVNKDFVETVILLPDNMFYNTSAPGIILICNKAKKHTDEILLINASNLFKKGSPKNFLPEDSIQKIADIYLNWKAEEGTSAIISINDAIKNDYNLSPSRYVAQNGEDDTLSVEDAVVQLQEAEEERKEVDDNLKSIMQKLGIEL